MTLIELEGPSAGAGKEMEMRLREIGARRLAIIGVGNSLKGDDFAGSLVAKKLMSKFNQAVQKPLILDAQDAPENFTEEIRAFGPDAVIFIDSAVMGCPPGTVKLVPLDETQYPYFSTHNLPLRLLNTVMGDVEDSLLIGIEPKTTEFCERMSEEVKIACTQVAQTIHKVIAEWS
jgi:hydrogenase 3 maturation protease